MVKTKRTLITPLYLSSQDGHFYVQVSPQGFVLQSVATATPLYRFEEPVLLLQGVAVNANTVHLVFLKTTGELCYTLIAKTGTPQTTVLTKLDVRSTKYSRLVLLPLGEMVHIFYAYAHQTLADLWYIEHRLWNGKTWQSVHLGEVVHPRFPLYQISTDTKGNIHFLSITSQGHQSLLFYSRFHGAFSVWSNPTQVMVIPQDILDVADILTPDNQHHLFWVSKTAEGQLEINWAKRSQAFDLSSTWHQAPAPIRLVEGPWQSFGSIEMNGSLWLLIKSERRENLMLYDGESWRLAANLPGQHQTLAFTHKTERSFYHTAWLDDGSVTHAPLFASQVGLDIPQIRRPVITPTPNPVPVAYSASQPGFNPAYPFRTALPPELPRAQEFVSSLATEKAPTAPSPEVIEANSSAHNIPVNSLSSVGDFPASSPPYPAEPAPDHFPASSAGLSSIVPAPVSAPPPDSSPPSPAEPAKPLSDPSPSPEPRPALETLVPLITAAINPLLQTVSHLTEEKKELSYALETLISRHNRTESVLLEVERQIKELHEQQLTNQERGFWSRWFR